MKISNNILLNETKKLVVQERKTLNQILTHLKEIERRKAYCPLGYSSLMKYLIYELKYSESAAYRRIQALKLTKFLPKAKKMIESGELSLTTISLVQSSFKDEQESIPEILQKVKNKTARECQQIIGDLRPQQKKREQKIILNSTETRVTWNLTNDVLDKMDKLQSLTKLYDTNSILNEVFDLAIKKLDPVNKRSNKVKTTSKTVSSLSKKKLYQRADGRCEYPGCKERHFLEIEHVTPKALGGSNDFSNLKLFCKSHNQHAAIEVFGLKKMERYIC